jgi:FkbM family methyltransferase
MNRSKTFRYVCLLIFLLSIVIYHSQKSIFLFFDIKFFSSKPTIFTDRVDLSIVTVEPFECVKTKVLLGQYRTTVCVHKVDQDRDVSRLLISSGIWEEPLVTHIVRILSTYKQYAFFDIGANIGVYTMYATSTGCSNVISIECFRPNIERIRRAIQHEQVQQKVILIPRALYKKSNVYLSLQANIRNNIGSQRLTNEVSKNDKDPLVVQTIRFDDLLPLVNERNISDAIIKIDIELSEHFLCETGQLMFDRINIAFVMMEWANIKAIPIKANLIRDFFINRHYLPYNPETCQPQKERDYRLWQSQDVYWIKKDSIHLCQL